MHLRQLTLAELRRELVLARTYFLDFLADQVLYTAGFFLLSGLFFLVASGEYDRPAQLGLLIGYLTWRVADGTILRLVRLTANDAQWGTLEQLVLGPLSLSQLLTGRVIALFLYHTGRALIIAVIAILLLQLRPTITFGAAILLLITQIGAWGVGYSLVGLHLVTKSVASVTIGVTTALLFLTGALAPLVVGTPIYYVAQFLPLSAGIGLLRQAMVEGISFGALLVQPAFYSLLINSSAYLLVGVAVLRWGERTALRQGTLAHY